MLVDLYVKEQQGMVIFTEGSNIIDYGVMWISLDSHSDGTHSLQRIHCWVSDVMLHFS